MAPINNGSEILLLDDDKPSLFKPNESKREYVENWTKDAYFFDLHHPNVTSYKQDGCIVWFGYVGIMMHKNMVIVSNKDQKLHEVSQQEPLKPIVCGAYCGYETQNDFCLLMFGGPRDDSSTIYRFTMSSGKWETIDPKQGPVPKGRRYSAFAFHKGRRSLFVHGGTTQGDQVSLADLWELQVDTLHWKEHSKFNIGKVSSHFMCCDGESIYVLTCGTANEMYQYNPYSHVTCKFVLHGTFNLQLVTCCTYLEALHKIYFYSGKTESIYAVTLPKKTSLHIGVTMLKNTRFTDVTFAK